MGEVVGSQIYATESIQPPRRHLAVNLVNLCTMIGGLAALCVTWYVVNIAGNWRIAFWIGSCIAVVGSIARIRLRETPEFARHVKLSKNKDKFKTQFSNILEMFKQKTSWSFVSIMQAYQVSFFVAYGYFNVHLKSIFKLTPEQLVDHNLKISLFSVVFNCFITWLVTKYDPLKIYYTKTLIFILCFVTSLFILIQDHSYVSLAIIQMMFISLGMDTMPTNGVTIANFDIANRFTTTAVLWALSRLTAHLIFIATLVWLTQYIGFYALLVVYTPLITLNMWGLFHYMKLENNRANLQKIFLRA
jgi:predicted MFS family arabinose efflux permease